MHGLEYIVKANKEAARKGVLGKAKREKQRKADHAAKLETKERIMKGTRG